MTTPPVLEKQSIDIDFSKGLNEKDRPESMDWTKGVKNAENVDFDEPGVLKPREGVHAITNGTGEGGITAQGISRLLSTGDGVLAVLAENSTAAKSLVQYSPALEVVTSKGKISEFSVSPSQLGSWVYGGVEGTLDNFPVLGVGITERYKLMLYAARTTLIEEDSDEALVGAVALVVADRNTDSVVRTYRVNRSEEEVSYAMTMVDNRYVHLYYNVVGDDDPKVIQIDTESLPATLPSATDLGFNDAGEFKGAVNISGASVALFNSDAGDHKLVKTTTASAVSSAAVTGFSRVTGLDTVGGNFYVVGIGTGIFDPASLDLTGWWRASYTGLPWEPAASAGSSGTVGDITSASVDPSVGSAVNGLTPADFDGADDAAYQTISETLDTLFNASSYSGWALVWADTVSTDSTNPYSNDTVVGTTTTSFWSIYLRSSNKVGVMNYDAAWLKAETHFSAGEWQLVQWKHTGTDIKIRVNNGPWVSTSAGSLDDLTFRLKLGTNWDTSQFFDGKLLELATSDAVLSDDDFDGVLEYARDRYDLTLNDYPATLSLTGWWRGSYAASPFVATISAGLSGTRNISHGATPPSSGAAVNGFTPADFDGVDDILEPQGGDAAVSNYASAGAYLWWALFYSEAAGGANDVGTAQSNPGLWGDNAGGYIGGNYRSDGGTEKIQVWHYDGARKGNEHAISLNAWNLICVRYDGTNIRSKLNSGSVSVSAAAGAVGDLSNTLVLGKSSSGGYHNQRVLDFGFIDSAGSDAVFDNIKEYVNSRYGLSL